MSILGVAKFGEFNSKKKVGKVAQLRSGARLNTHLTMSKSLSKAQIASAQVDGDYAIKSESTSPKLDTSQWPLLLKNYDKLIVRSSHFTPIPTGCSPLKRDITSYIK